MPSVEGQAPERAAEVTAEAVCEHVARCGLISILCSDCDGSDDECGGCFVEHRDVTYDACTQDAGPDFATGFACEALTEQEEADVDACLAALGDLACPSVEAAEMWANGGGGDDPRGGPEACRVVEDIRYRCFDYGNPSGDPGEPLPG